MSRSEVHLLWKFLNAGFFNPAPATWICTYGSPGFECCLFSQGCVLNSKHLVNYVWIIFIYNQASFICTSRAEIEITLSLMILNLDFSWIELFLFFRMGEGPPGPLISKSAFVFEVWLFSVLFSKIELIAWFSSWSTANYSGSQLVWQKQLMHYWQFLIIHALACDLLMRKGVS